MANLFERRILNSEIEKLASQATAARQVSDYAAAAAAWRGCEVRCLSLGKRLLAADYAKAAANCDSLAAAVAAQCGA